jgi:hypothetical protein
MTAGVAGGGADLFSTPPRSKPIASTNHPNQELVMPRKRSSPLDDATGVALVSNLLLLYQQLSAITSYAQRAYRHSERGELDAVSVMR